MAMCLALAWISTSSLDHITPNMFGLEAAHTAQTSLPFKGLQLHSYSLSRTISIVPLNEVQIMPSARTTD